MLEDVLQKQQEKLEEYRRSNFEVLEIAAKAKCSCKLRRVIQGINVEGILHKFENEFYVGSFRFNWYMVLEIYQEEGKLIIMIY